MNSNSPLKVIPSDLFVNKLPNGQKEFFCYVCFPNSGLDQGQDFSWRISFGTTGSLSGERSITDREREQQRVPLGALLPAAFEAGELTVRLAAHQGTWKIRAYDQRIKFRLPLEGQVLVVVGHRIGEPHRATQIGSEHFAWDLVPFDHDGLRLLRCPLPEQLEAQHFVGFGRPLLAPADGLIVKAVDGMEDLTRANEIPTNLDYFREDLNRAPGNHVIIEHGNGIWSLLAHFKKGSVQVKEGQEVKTRDRLGELGNSGFSSGPHLHLQFMNGPGLLTASPLPIELDLEGGTYAPQAGEITSSENLSPM